MARTPRILLGLILAGLAYWLFTRMQAVNAAESTDPTPMIGYFLGFLATAIVAGALLAFTLLPAIGELFGNSVYGSNESLEPDPHHDATAAMARGDFEAADQAYQKIIAERPDDSLAVTELVRLRLEKREDPAGAATVLEKALAREWPPDEAGGMAIRLGDIYADHFHDPERARTMWSQILETMPGSRHAANANTRLQQLPPG